jgi:sugar porter (SP) family MFS transporter
VQIVHTDIPSESGLHATTSNTIYVSFLASVAGISGFLFGFDTAIINGVLVLLRHQFLLSDIQTEVAASSLLFGCLFGAGVASLVGDAWGRKKSLILSAFLFAVSTLGASLASGIWLFSEARFVGGLAIGLASVLTPIYISEISPAHRRGALVSLNQLGIVIGILAAYITSWKLNHAQGNDGWRWMLAAGIVPALLFLFGLFVVPESPRWLITHQHVEDGRKVLKTLMGPEEAERQILLIHAANETSDATWAEVFSKPMRRRLRIGLVLAFLCQVTGINAVLYYGGIFFQEHVKGLGNESAFKANVLIGVINLAGTIAAMALMDRWGRRPMLLTAAAGMFLSLSVLVAAFLRPSTPAALILAAILAYVGFFALAMGPVPWVIMSEIFPTRIRGRAVALATSVLWGGCLLVTSTFLSMLRTLGSVGTFSLFAGLSLVSFLFVLTSVPETRKKTLEELNEHLAA